VFAIETRLHTFHCYIINLFSSSHTNHNVGTFTFCDRYKCVLQNYLLVMEGIIKSFTPLSVLRQASQAVSPHRAI